jgi:hypothetical protein
MDFSRNHADEVLTQGREDEKGSWGLKHFAGTL